MLPNVQRYGFSLTNCGNTYTVRTQSWRADSFSAPWGGDPPGNVAGLRLFTETRSFQASNAPMMRKSL